MVGAEGARAIRQALAASEGFGKSIWAVATGIVTFLLGATAVFGELQSALNRIWDVRVEPTRGIIFSLLLDRLRSFAIALGVGFLLLVSPVVSATLALFGMKDVDYTDVMPPQDIRHAHAVTSPDAHPQN